MNTQATVQVLRYETGWMAMSCNNCRIIIWQGEEVWWTMGKFTAMDLIRFWLKHQCRSTS